MDQVIYNNDTRYPGPSAHPPPDYIHGIPTRAELDAYPRMFTWGELKEIVQTGELERLMRNKAMQARYDEWMVGIKVQYGSTEKYLTRARLPWSSSSTADPAGTYDLSQSPTTQYTTLPVDLVPSTNPSSSIPIQAEVDGASHAATPGGRGAPSLSGTATPSSAGFVSLASLKIVNGRLRSASGSKRKSDITALAESGSGVSTPRDERSTIASAGESPAMKASQIGTTVQSLQDTIGSLQLDANGPQDGSSSKSSAMEPTAQPNQDSGEGVKEGDQDEEEEDEPPVYLKWDDENGLDGEKYAVLPNDWPYNVPYGVRHYCVWSRVPIAHPELVDYDPESWARVEVEGLGGFSGTTPLREFHIPSPTSSTPPSVASPTSPNHDTSSSITSTSLSDTSRGMDTPKKDSVLFTKEMVSQTKLIGRLQERDWYAADVAYAGEEMRRWAGVTYESKGGQEVGKMVRGLWDPRGWECLWFVNPPRLQSVPGFSHFHVFARRKTPEEIDASEAFC